MAGSVSLALNNDNILQDRLVGHRILDNNKVNIKNISSLTNVMNNSVHKLDETLKKKVEFMSQQLRFTISTQEKIQDEMSYLQQKEVDLNSIKKIGLEIKKLSEDYKDFKLSDEEKDKVKSRTSDLLKEVESIVNVSKFKGYSTMSEKVIKLGEDTVVTSSSFKIILSFEKEENLPNKNFENKLRVEDILEKPFVIEEKIINPVNKALDEVNDNKSRVYNKFLGEHSKAMNYIEDLFNIGGISGYMKDIYEKSQNSLLNSINDMRFQSEALSARNVLELLK